MHENVVDFKIDTGSGLTIISETTYLNCFAKCDLIKNNVSLKTYSGERFLVLGYIKVDVVYGGKKYCELKLYVIEGEGVKFIGP